MQLQAFAHWLEHQSKQGDARKFVRAAARFHTGKFFVACMTAGICAALIGTAIISTWAWDSAAHLASFVAVLCIGNACHILWIARHERHVRALAASFNEFAAIEGLDPMDLQIELFRWSIWLILGLPILLAPAMHARYTQVTGPRFRREFSRRVQDILRAQMPAVFVPQPAFLQKVCGYTHCHAQFQAMRVIVPAAAAAHYNPRSQCEIACRTCTTFSPRLAGRGLYS